MAGVLIIGAGQAAGQAAASLRQEKFEGPITIVGEEGLPPYQRPPLSKGYLSGEVGVDKVLVRPSSFYDDKEISLQLNTKATQINCSSKTVTTDNHQKYEYDNLIIATGSRPREMNLPGSELGGIHYLRTVSDVDSIRTELGSAKKVCIVGGGYIGLEVAAVAKTIGLEVTVLEMESRILQRVTTPEMSEYYLGLHTSKGVRILCNTRVTSFEGNDSVVRVMCDSESIEADLVVVGIGILPNVELAQKAGIKCDNGIMVNERCQTSQPDVYAAGDCTNHPNPILKKRLRLESVPNAMEQARVVSNNIVGGSKTYESVPWFWSDQYGLKLQMLGFSADGEKSIVRGKKSENEFAVFYLQESKIVAVDAVNSPKEFMLSKQLYGKVVDPDRLADSTSDLKKMLE